MGLFVCFLSGRMIHTHGKCVSVWKGGWVYIHACIKVVDAALVAKKRVILSLQKL